MTDMDFNEDAAHLADFVVNDIEEDAFDGDLAPVDQVDETDEMPPEPVQMDKAAFYVVFSTAFNMPAMISRDFGPLAIQPEEERAARAASDGIYDLLEIYYPAALMPQGRVAASLLAAGPFIFGKVMVVREIFAAKRRAKVEAEEKAAREANERRFGRAPEKQPPQEESQQQTNAPQSSLAWMDAEGSA